MKYNLVFTGLRETSYENIEEKQRDFLGQELKIEHLIDFGNAHLFVQRKPENEDMRKKLSDPQTDFCSL